MWKIQNSFFLVIKIGLLAREAMVSYVCKVSRRSDKNCDR